MDVAKEQQERGTFANLLAHALSLASVGSAPDRGETYPDQIYPTATLSTLHSSTSHVGSNLVWRRFVINSDQSVWPYVIMATDWSALPRLWSGRCPRQDILAAVCRLAATLRNVFSFDLATVQENQRRKVIGRDDIKTSSPSTLCHCELPHALQGPCNHPV